MTVETKKVNVNQLRSGSVVLIDGSAELIAMIDKSNQHNPFASITFMNRAGMSKITDGQTFDRIKY